MAKVCLGGGFFLLESVVSGYTLLGESLDALPAAVLMTVLGAVPVACQIAKSAFNGEADLEADADAA